MANSRFEYVKNLETAQLECQRAPLGAWIVIRLDGRGFHRFSTLHNFQKPNDERALNLMNRTAYRCMLEHLDETVIAIGASDEYSLVFHPHAKLFGRRMQKLASTVASVFTAIYMQEWPLHFADTPMHILPTFDARCVYYTNTQQIRDYLAWRQSDFHINNVYNVCFWALVQQCDISRQQAHKLMFSAYKSSDAKQKLMRDELHIDYTAEPAMYRKGTVIIRKQPCTLEKKQSVTSVSKSVLEEHNIVADSLRNSFISSGDSDNPKITASLPVTGTSYNIQENFVVTHEDIIGDAFWQRHIGLIPYISLQEFRRRAKEAAQASKCMSSKSNDCPICSGLCI